MSLEELGKKKNEVGERLMRGDPELKKTTDRLLKQKRDFDDRYKVQVFDILTDEQMARFVRLVNNPPEFAKKFMDKRKKVLGEQEESGGWQPGPNSWRPGDPIPEGYLQQREERQTRQRGLFPRTERPDAEPGM
jgi:hypothetical protein